MKKVSVIINDIQTNKIIEIDNQKMKRDNIRKVVNKWLGRGKSATSKIILKVWSISKNKYYLVQLVL